MIAVRHDDYEASGAGRKKMGEAIRQVAFEFSFIREAARNNPPIDSAFAAAMGNQLLYSDVIASGGGEPARLSHWPPSHSRSATPRSRPTRA
jgi:hypothetical protein